MVASTYQNPVLNCLLRQLFSSVVQHLLHAVVALFEIPNACFAILNQSQAVRPNHKAMAEENDNSFCSVCVFVMDKP